MNKIIITNLIVLIITLSSVFCFATTSGDEGRLLQEGITNEREILLDKPTKSNALEDGDEPKTDGYYFWKIDGKQLVNSEYAGSYVTVGSATVRIEDAPQDVTATGSRTYSHQVKGSLKVTKKMLEASVGFSYGFSTTKTISLTKRDASAGTYLAQSRGIYYRYKVKQQQYYHVDGNNYKIGSPVYCYVNKFRYENHRLIKK